MKFTTTLLEMELVAIPPERAVLSWNLLYVDNVLAPSPLLELTASDRRNQVCQTPKLYRRPVLAQLGTLSSAPEITRTHSSDKRLPVQTSSTKIPIPGSLPNPRPFPPV